MPCSVRSLAGAVSRAVPLLRVDLHPRPPPCPSSRSREPARGRRVLDRQWPRAVEVADAHPAPPTLRQRSSARSSVGSDRGARYPPQREPASAGSEDAPRSHVATSRSSPARSGVGLNLNRLYRRILTAASKPSRVRRTRDASGPSPAQPLYRPHMGESATYYTQSAPSPAGSLTTGRLVSNGQRFSAPGIPTDGAPDASATVPAGAVCNACRLLEKTVDEPVLWCRSLTMLILCLVRFVHHPCM